MKVLMTADTVGGVWAYAMELGAALGARGVEVVLATMGALPSADQRDQAAALPNVRLEVSEFRLEWMPDPREDVAAAGEWLVDLERRERPDVVHLNGYAHGRLPFAAPVLVVGHSCVLSWWRAVRGVEAPRAWDWYRREVTAGLQSADLVAAPTAWMARQLERRYGPLSRLAVIPNGRDGALFGPGPKRGLVLAAGRLWDEGKNIGALMRVAPALPWPVWVAGEARGPDGRVESVERVRWLGRLSEDDLGAAMGQAAIFAHAARYEPFGLAPLEAALAGCALVLGDIPPLREVWGPAAVYVPPDDDGALREALRGLIRDGAERERLALAARRRARRYSRERLARAYGRTYERLVAEAPVAGRPA